QSAIFDLSSLITVLLLIICTCTYTKGLRPTIFDSSPEPPTNNGAADMAMGGATKHRGIKGFCWKLSRIGERLSPYISASCLAMAVHTLFIKQ
ncbi:unnamed protein product, partial [Chrysoparadoxa australica]